MKRNILFLLSLCMLLLTCSDGNDPIKEIEKPKEENPFITLKKANIDFTNDGGSESILIESNVTWTTKSSAGWCTVTPSSGNKSTESITIAATENKEYDNRSCTVTLESGNISKTITVNQGENLGLLITQDRYELGNEESTIKVEVKANVDFEVEIHDEWITQVETRGLTTLELAFKIAKNDSYDNREGSITIKQKGGGMTSTITIFQSQEDAIILSEKDFDLSSEAQAVKVEIKTNIDYEIIIPEDAKDWVSHSATRALRTETVVLDIAKNEDYDERTVEVIVKDKKTNLQETVSIKQAANTGLIVSPNKYEVSNNGGSFNVEVRANVDYKVTINDNWITQIKTRGLTTTNLSFEVPKNESYSNREGTITISQTDGDLSSIITVYQSQENAIILSEKNIELTSDAQSVEVDVKTNIDYEIIIPEEAKSWVSYIETRSLRSEVVLLNITSNENIESRITEVVFKNKQTSIQDKLIIHQNSNESYVYYVEKMGTLTTILNQTQKDTITTMIVKGEINNKDFELMKRNMPKLKYIDLKEVKCKDDKIPYQAFGGYYANNKIVTVILPKSITTIEDDAFSGCVSLAGSLNLPDGLTKIGLSAFNSCKNLTGPLNLPNGLITIGNYAFNDNKGLVGSLNFPEGLTTIGNSAFRNCTGLTGSLTFSDNLKTIGMSAFSGCKGLTGSLIFPDGLTSIGSSAFNECSGLKGSLKIPDGVNEIGAYTFFRCTSLKGTLMLPRNLTYIGAWAFYGCKGLTGSLSLPDGVKMIGERAFGDCSGFTGSLKLNTGLERIGDMAFGDCTGFTGSLTLPSGLTDIGTMAFSRCSGFNGTLTLPDGLKRIGSEAFIFCTGFTGSLNLPKGLISISRHAFRGCSGFDGSLNFSEDLKYIGESAFEGCSGFTGTLTIPVNVEEIHEFAFAFCSGFSGTLNFPDKLKYIRRSAFNGCSGFTGSLILPDELKSIGFDAFKNCSDISGTIVFPTTLFSVAGFYGCDKIDAFRFPHTTPLTHYSDAFPINATIEVPLSAVEKYKATSGWKYYNIVGY